ncbi:glycosyltransferase family 2 protein [Chryseobacterium sp. R2A-55]|uniref:glycosyltransferase family 2 protein n=1 Tax=Chryseobacterium sp. R2A-55 TaxID=2744445 RepID=UPI001F49221C|nr:glycosyltransferase family 2 protein [Chryseobacterium sp. R2A-55]
MKKVFIIISAYNEQENILSLIDALKKNLDGKEFLYEMVFVNDGSDDLTLQVLLESQKTIPHLTIVNQSKNFGHEIAMTAGLNYVADEIKNKSDEFAVVFMDADLQHPPELVSQMITLWQSGRKLVLTKRTNNHGKGWRYKILGNLYYWILNSFSDLQIPRNMPDFRLLDKKYVLWINRLNETDRMFRGMLSLVGMQDAHIIEFAAPRRNAGSTKYNFLKLYKLAIDSVIQFSVKPLRIAFGVGVLGCLFSFGVLFYSIYRSYWYGEDKTGFLTLLSITTFFSSITIIFLGVIGEYIGRIHIEVKNRPLYYNEIIKNED